MNYKSSVTPHNRTIGYEAGHGTHLCGIATAVAIALAASAGGMITTPAEAQSIATGAISANTSGSGTTSQHAQKEVPDNQQLPKRKQKPKVQTLQEVDVTGSMIPEAQVQTAVPTVTLDAQQLQRSGFTSIYAALRAQPLATGAVLDSQTTGEFSAAAKTISLLGLEPGFTLILIDGHPISSYPLPYNGAGDFTDIANIPMGMVQRIDIVPGNLSSIYGSSAIAGVVNIILKKHVTGYELNLQTGSFSGGGGANRRIQFLGGLNRGKLNLTYGLEFSDQKPMFASQRAISASTLANPDPNLQYGTPIFGHDYLNSSFRFADTDPGSACGPVSGLLGGTVARDARPNSGPPFNSITGAPTGPGYYCGSPLWPGERTLLNKDRSGSVYLHGTYTLNDNNELYTTVLYTKSDIQTFSGPQFWQANLVSLTGSGLFYNANTAQFERLWRWFTPEEAGGWQNESASTSNRRYDAWVGLQGYANNIHYNVFFSRSQDNVNRSFDWLLTDKVNSFFQTQVLGPELGTQYGYPIYAPNLENFYKPVTPQQYAAMNGTSLISNVSWIQSVNATVSDSDIFDLPAGPVGLAATFQYGEQDWSNPVNTAVQNGTFYDLTATSGAGTRTNGAFGMELNAPLTSMLTLDASGRFDHFANRGGGAQGKGTYRAGLEFRPVESLLFRASYATAFRAPDMAYVFSGASGSYIGGFTDYLRCDRLGGPLSSCPYFANQSFLSVHSGNAHLDSITAKSADFGIVWSPSAEFNVNGDIYDIKISNEVMLQSVDSVLKEEALCLTGQADATSSPCVQAMQQVTRQPASSPSGDSIQQISVEPINIARERITGALLGAKYSHRLGKFGTITLTAAYNNTLRHVFQQSADSPSVDLLGQPNVAPFSTEFKTITNASVTWATGRWVTTLFATRYGKTPNWAAQNNGYGTDVAGFNGQAAGTVAPWTLFNGSVQFMATPKLRLTFIVNNIRNSMPPTDLSRVSWPYYSVNNYNPYGREFFLNLDYRFGTSGR